MSFYINKNKIVIQFFDTRFDMMNELCEAYIEKFCSIYEISNQNLITALTYIKFDLECFKLFYNYHSDYLQHNISYDDMFTSFIKDIKNNAILNQNNVNNILKFWNTYVDNDC